jgi:hypothetical protein
MQDSRHLTKTNTIMKPETAYTRFSRHNLNPASVGSFTDCSAEWSQSRTINGNKSVQTSSNQCGAGTRRINEWPSYFGSLFTENSGLPYFLCQNCRVIIRRVNVPSHCATEGIQEPA